MPSLPLYADLPNLGGVCHLGLATRGSRLDAASVIAAIDWGINYLNSCGQPGDMRDAIRGLGSRREEVVISLCRWKASSAGNRLLRRRPPGANQTPLGFGGQSM